MKLCLTFDDVLIQPKFSTIRSRKDVSLDNGYSKLPLIAANMDTVCGSEMAKAMRANGALGCLHRFWSIGENIAALENSNFEGRLPWVSVGVGVQELERTEALFDAGARAFIIDVAHGAQLQVVEQYKKIHELFTKENIILCVGNFATGESIEEFSKALGYKPDMVKIGIGPGSACTTRIKTGCGYPQLTALLDCGRVGIPMIADGGCKTSGDIAKALACKNVEMVMLGGMLAGTEETPGEVLQDKDVYVGNSYGSEKSTQWEVPRGPKYKKYRGSASKESYADQNKDWTCAEGETFTVPYKGSVQEILLDIEGGLKSSFSYVGASNLKEFQKKAEFVQITNAGYIEGTPHGKT